jgi:large-conductance mechanosensitive channel
MIKRFRDFLIKSSFVEIALGLILATSAIPVVKEFVEIFTKNGFSQGPMVFYNWLSSLIVFLFTAVIVMLIGISYEKLTDKYRESKVTEVEVLSQIKELLEKQSQQKNK